MDREYYNSLTEAYNLIERGPTGGVKDAPVKIGDLFGRGKGGGQGNRGRRGGTPGQRVTGGTPTRGGSTPVVAPPKPPSGGGGGGDRTGGGGGSSIKRDPAPTPAPTPAPRPAAAAPAPKPKPKPSAATRGFTMDRDLGRETGVTGGKPASSTGGSRLDSALKFASDAKNKDSWMKEDLDAIAQQFVEANMADSIENARVILTHLDDEAIARLLA